MLYGLMLPSGNDAAIALAQRAAGGSDKRFVRYMNEKAKQMGLVCTHFSTPSGFEDKDNHSCAADLAAIGRAVLREPRLARIVGKREAIVPFPIKGGRLFLYNHNPLLRQGYRGTTGIKTGYTDAAGQMPRGDGEARAGQARRRPARLARPGQAGDAAARPRLQSLSRIMNGWADPMTETSAVYQRRRVLGDRRAGGGRRAARLRGDAADGLQRRRADRAGAESRGRAKATAKPKPLAELPRGGRRILPDFRVVAFYGAPQDKQLGDPRDRQPDRR